MTTPWSTSVRAPSALGKTRPTRTGPSPRESLELARQEARLALARDRSSGFGQPGREEVIEAWGRYAVHDPASEEAAAALMSA